MLTVVVDTNLFLQCKPLQDIDWLALDPAGVRLIVPMTVVKELDKAKSDGNGRRARRARLATPLFRTGRLAPDPRIPIANRPGCTWEFGSGELLWHEQLDRDLPDHRLLAEARHIAQADAEAVLLSGDMSVLVLAQRLGLRNMELPESWALAAEPDERDKIIQDLKSELTAVQADRPSIVVHVSDSQALSIDGFRFDTYRAPTDAELETLMELATSEHPLVDSPPTASDQEEILVSVGEAVRVTPSSMEFRQYRYNDYPKWVQDTRAVLSALPYFWSASQRCVELTLTVRNGGRGPALGVIFEYEVHDGAVLLPIDDEDREAFLVGPSLPKPPKVPGAVRCKVSQFADIPVHPLPNFDFPENRNQRHRYSFYRDDDYRKPVNRHVWECEELRHGKEVDFALTVLLPLTAEGECALVCKVSSRNAPEVVKAVALRFRGHEVDPIPRLTAMLQRPKPKKPKVPTLRLRMGPNGLEVDDSKPKKKD